MVKDKISFDELKSLIQKEKKILKEIISSQKYANNSDNEERRMVSSHVKLLKQSLKKANEQIPKELSKLHLIKPLTRGKEINVEEKDDKKEGKNEQKESSTSSKDASISERKKESEKIKTNDKKVVEQINENRKSSFDTSQLHENIPYAVGERKIYSKKDLRPDKLEIETIKRIRKRKEEKVKKEKEQKANPYVKYANKLFSKMSNKFFSKENVKQLEENLIKANLKYTPHSYISVVFLTSVISFFVGLFIMLFFLFFKVSAVPPFLSTPVGTFSVRILRVFWIPILVPIGTFFVMLFYPSLEKDAAGLKIDLEVPFATIHMSAISGSMIDPSQIFNIMIITKEYPYLEKEFTKLLNEINIYGYDLVSALKNASVNTPSKKLSELYTGLATTINSGGDLAEFFEKRSQTLLFENTIEKERKTKVAETYMDIYISVVIAAPMILMMLLMMMKISGLGLSLSITMITLIMVMVVTIINIIFLTFLGLKK